MLRSDTFLFYDILHPEVVIAGGILMIRKIGAMAEAFGKRVV